MSSQVHARGQSPTMWENIRADKTCCDKEERNKAFIDTHEPNASFQNIPIAHSAYPNNPYWRCLYPIQTSSVRARGREKQVLTQRRGWEKSEEGKDEQGHVYAITTFVVSASSFGDGGNVENSQNKGTRIMKESGEREEEERRIEWWQSAQIRCSACSASYGYINSAPQ